MCICAGDDAVAGAVIGIVIVVVLDNNTHARTQYMPFYQYLLSFQPSHLQRWKCLRDVNFGGPLSELSYILSYLMLSLRR